MIVTYFSQNLEVNFFKFFFYMNCSLCKYEKIKYLILGDRYGYSQDNFPLKFNQEN